MPDLISTWLQSQLFSQIFTAIVGILIIVLIVRFLQRTLSAQIKQTETRYKFRKLTTFTGYVVGVLFLLSVFVNQLGNFTVAFGIASAGIAFALQEVIASIAGWLAASFSSFYKVGDRVQLGGIKGDVIDINILRTTLMECGNWVGADLYNGRIVRIANSFIFKEPVFNYSAHFPFLWDEITVPVTYGGDYRLAREILERVAGELTQDYVPVAREAWKEVIEHYLIEEENVAPVVTMVANDNWMEFTVRYVVDYKKRRGFKDRLFTHILEAFEQTEGRVALASATVQIVGVPPFDVRLQDHRGPGGEKR
ncbi:MAG: mechanosensitive ion channel [Anaerolineae bacterium]|nr:mechanosensitive ion channel [Anaerolineae bacterium]